MTKNIANLIYEVYSSGAREQLSTIKSARKPTDYDKLKNSEDKKGRPNINKQRSNANRARSNLEKTIQKAKRNPDT